MIVFGAKVKGYTIVMVLVVVRILIIDCGQGSCLGILAVFFGYDHGYWIWL